MGESHGGKSDRRGALLDVGGIVSGPRREPPELPGFRMVARERIPIGRVSWIGVATVPFWLVLFILISRVLGGPRFDQFEISVLDAVVALAIILVGVPVLHEAVHGIVARLAGARPTFGIGPGFAYTTFREPVGKLAYLAIGLAPLVLLSVAGVALMVVVPSIAGKTLLFVVTNGAGAVGDLWIAWSLRRLPSDARIYDLADGFAAYVREG